MWGARVSFFLKKGMVQGSVPQSTSGKKIDVMRKIFFAFCLAWYGWLWMPLWWAE